MAAYHGFTRAGCPAIYLKSLNRSQMTASFLKPSLAPITAGFDLDDLGERIYLKHLTPPASLAIKDYLFPEKGLASSGGPFPTRPIANISYGIQASAAGVVSYGWFKHATQGGLNLSAKLPSETGSLIACAEPFIDNYTS